MAPANNTLRPSLAGLQRRSRELLAWQAAHGKPSPASPNDAPDADAATPGGLGKDQIGSLFYGHVTRDRIDRVLQQLTSLDVISLRPHETGRGPGRRPAIWAPAGGAKDACQDN